VRTVALTFDDAPTGAILDPLERRGMRATPRLAAGLLDRIAARGYEAGLLA
jgi:peptidoglycan/xylan/chitin deacetylase (PgdA/CDA1 family)